MTSETNGKPTKSKSIFITVGTTLFEPLIECISKSSFLNIIASHGYGRLVIQYGKGSNPIIGTDIVPSEESQSSGTFKASGGDSIEWEIYQFKPSLEADMQNADLIISHAGAGSIMEGLALCRERNMDDSNIANDNDNDNDNATADDAKINNAIYKKLVVVINDQLMDNHQMELAEALADRGYLFMLTGPSLLLKPDVMDRIEAYRPKPFEGGDSMTFGRLLDNFMGFEKNL